MAKKKTAQREQLFELHEPVQAMPVGYYSGDKPNPNLRRFVEENSKPYDPETDEYNVAAFSKQITSTKATAIYNMHTYWSKKPHDAIRQYIQHYTQPGEIVLDPFCGSGGTALAALMDGRKAIAIDRSPAATFITKNYCTPIDPVQLQIASEILREKMQPEMDWLYETRCDRCDGKAITVNTVYSQVFQCPKCLIKVPLFNCIEIESTTQAGKPKKINVCPHCKKKDHLEEIKSQSSKFGSIPVLASYICKGSCKPARAERRRDDSDQKKRQYFEKYDLGKLNEIEELTIPYWFPTNKMMNVDDDTKPWGAEWREGRNFRSVADLFTKRNLWALATLLDHINKLDCPDNLRSAFLFVFQANLLSGTRMQRYREAGGGFANGTYYLPQLALEREQVGCYNRKLQDMLAGFRDLAQLLTPCLLVSTQSAIEYSTLPSNSLDYVFTDPPYSHTIQYGELNFIWEAWLGFDTRWHDDEVVVNSIRFKSEADWATLMKRAMAECYRVLKPGRWLSLCYHDTSEGTWELVQDIMAEVGFVVDKTEKALFIDTGQKSYNQLTADKATKRDLVINFRKPKSMQFAVTKIYSELDLKGLSPDIATFREYASQLIRDYLTKRPGATKDRIYDELVSLLVSSRSMEAHDFETLLRSVADEVQEPVKKNLFENEEPNLFGTHVQSRWYLKETADEIDQAEQAKEDAVAKRLETFIEDSLTKKPEDEGVHYSDLFEQFLPVQDKPRRLLGDWLPEYFIKTASGTWRVPNKDESKQLEILRVQGTLRRIKRFANALIQGVPIRDKDRPASDSDSLDWLRQCRRAGLYEQGKAIYEKGGLNSANLTDEQQIEAEDDYRICARRGSEETGKPKTKKRKPKEEA